LGSLLLASGDADGAVREGKAEVALNGEAVESHYELAKALHAAHRVKEAKDEVVLALEAAPNYKPAQQLLLQLSQ
jgi:cellulose synthase operon protein C